MAENRLRFLVLFSPLTTDLFLFLLFFARVDTFQIEVNKS